MNIKNTLLAMCLCGISMLPLEAQQVWTPDNGDGTFTNPLMWGDWPDPDVIRVGDDFYLVSTSMHYVPGSPVAKSKDLVNWEIVGYAVDRYDEDPRYDMQGGNLYLNGSWANSLTVGAGRPDTSPSAKPRNRKDRGSGPSFRNIFTTRDCFSMMMARYM